MVADFKTDARLITRQHFLVNLACRRPVTDGITECRRYVVGGFVHARVVCRLIASTNHQGDFQVLQPQGVQHFVHREQVGLTAFIEPMPNAPLGSANAFGEFLLREFLLAQFGSD